MSRQQGFTLIELLLAMGIAALLALLAYQGIEQIVTLKSTADAQQKQQAALTRAFYLMEQDWLQIAPRPAIDATGQLQPAVGFDGARLIFSRVSLGLTPTGETGVIRVGYWLDEGRLIRATWPVVDAAPDTEPTTQVLLQGVEEIHWSFFDPQKRPHTRWPDVDSPQEGLKRLPLALKLTLRLNNGQTWVRWLMGVR